MIILNENTVIYNENYILIKKNFLKNININFCFKKNWDFGIVKNNSLFIYNINDVKIDDNYVNLQAVIKYITEINNYKLFYNNNYILSDRDISLNIEKIKQRKEIIIFISKESDSIVFRLYCMYDNSFVIIKSSFSSIVEYSKKFKEYYKEFPISDNSQIKNYTEGLKKYFDNLLKEIEIYDILYSDIAIIRIIWEIDNLFIPFEISGNIVINYIWNTVRNNKKLENYNNDLAIVYDKDINFSNEHNNILNIFNSICNVSTYPFGIYKDNISSHRILHIICHGNSDGLINIDNRWSDIIEGYQNSEFVFLNACYAGISFEGIIKYLSSKTNFLIAPLCKIGDSENINTFYYYLNYYELLKINDFDYEKAYILNSILNRKFSFYYRFFRFI